MPLNISVAQINMVQDILERSLILEHASYYTPMTAEMDEATFIR
ncbi:MAG: DUF692 family multinuclear iron-containing protein [Flavobacteriales bacterium]